MRKGFTLVELIVVIIIIGILATVAVPQYLKATERAKIAKAKNALALISQGEKLYRAENDTYIALVGADANGILGSYIELDAVDADTEWTCSTTTADATTFTLQAMRNGGAYDTQVITLDDKGVWTYYTP